MHVQASKFLKSNITVNIELVEVVYYLKQVFHLLFFQFHSTIQNDLVVVVYYLKQVYNLLYNKSITPAEALHHFSLVL